MKVKVHIRIFDEDRVLEIPCGVGDKTFKWLAMVSCQRFAAMAPNGALRRKEDIRGATEHVQHLPHEVYLDNGDMPHPDAQLADFIKDGDDVFIGLLDSQNITRSTMSPQKSKWSQKAFDTTKSSSEHRGYAGSESGVVGSDEDMDAVEAESEASAQRKVARANFMKIMLKSQMINVRMIEHEVQTEWARSFAIAMPLLKPRDAEAIRIVLEQNWDVTKELYNTFAADGTPMTSEGHFQVCDAIKLYASEMGGQGATLLGEAKDMSKVCKRIFEKSQHSLRAENVNYMSFSAFLVSLVLHSQTRFHDMSSSSLTSLNCSEAIQELYSRCIRPWAKNNAISSYLKEEFCKDQFLSSIRDLSEDLFKLFQKHASKSKDVPTSLEPQHMAELLSDCKMQPAGAAGLSQTQGLLESVRTGCIFGRNQLANDLHIKEFLFPEFIESLARAGFFKYNFDNSSSAEFYFMKGIRCALDYKPEPPPANTTKK